jgi:hypothetical protein
MHITNHIRETVVSLLALLVVILVGPQVCSADENIRGHWRMDDGVGLKIADSSGNGNDGETKSIRWTAGVHKSAVQFNRGGGIECGNDASLNIEDAISIDAWLKPWSPRHPEQPTILRKEGAYALHLGPTKAASLTLWLDGNEERLSAPLSDWPNNQWRHVAGTFDGQTMKVYINGKLANEKQVDVGKKIRLAIPLSRSDHQESERISADRSTRYACPREP